MRTEEEIRKMLNFSKQVEKEAKKNKAGVVEAMAVVHTLEWVLGGNDKSNTSNAKYDYNVGTSLCSNIRCYNWDFGNIYYKQGR